MKTTPFISGPGTVNASTKAHNSIDKILRRITGIKDKINYGLIYPDQFESDPNYKDKLKNSLEELDLLVSDFNKKITSLVTSSKF